MSNHPVRHQRPLSPHLQVYRLPLTALLSITHRFTGVILSLGLLAIALGLMVIAHGAQYYLMLQTLVSSWLGWGFIGIWIFALAIHCCHGIRHLFWDAGCGFSYEQLSRLAFWEITGALFLTALIWLIAGLLR